MKFKGARVLVECLKRENVDTIFCYIGGAVIPIFDELYTNGKEIRRITPRHEQAAAHAADGYARSTGKPGVVLVTSGPGATNTITGIATAYMDSVPLVILTGQVPSNYIGTDAFQESDITGMTMPVTKATFRVRSVKEIPDILSKAFSICMSGRKGPVLVDIPVDIQKGEDEIEFFKKNGTVNTCIESSFPKSKINEIMKSIDECEKPLILAGGGIISSNSSIELNEFSMSAGIPLVNTLMGYGCSSVKNHGYFGGIGMHGSIYGNYAVSECDLLIALGTRFSDRIIGNPKTFAPKAKIIHVDIDPAEIGKNIDVDISVEVSVKLFLKKIPTVKKNKRWEIWMNEISEMKKKFPLKFKTTKGLKPQHVISKCSQIFNENPIIVTDVGQHQMWVPQFFPISTPFHYLTSGGLGTMGYALPAAIGAKIGNPEKEVLMFSGDGGIQMNIQELITLKRYNLNLKMIIIDNRYLGMVRQWQQLMCAGRYAETEMDDNPDFVKVAEAYGVRAVRASTVDECEKELINLKNSREPMLIHFPVEREENVLPMVPPGKALNESITEINSDFQGGK